MMDHEFGNNVRFMLQGPPVNCEEMALELIEEFGPGGSFLTHKHTFKRARKQSKYKLFDRSPFAARQNAGAKTMTERAYDQARNIIETYEPQPLAAQAQAEVDALLADFIKRNGPK